MIDTTTVDKIAYCASNLAYDFNSDGVFLPNKYPKRYQNDPYLKYLHQCGAQRIIPFSNSEGWFWDPINAAIIIEFQRYTLLAFRGTIPPSVSCLALQDWLNDLLVDTKPVRGFEGRVHAGIYDAYDTLKSDIFNELNNRKGLPLVITGHSKGGPMTTYAAYDALNLDHSVYKVITFASPRPGNSEFANAYNSIMRHNGLTQTRFENDLDIVPLLPPEKDRDQEYAALLSAMAYGLKLMKHPDMAAALETIAGMLEAIYHLDYYPVGELRYITKDHNIVPNSPSLWSTRSAQFLNLFEEHPLTALSYIMHAHSIGIGGGYQKGVFPSLKK